MRSYVPKLNTKLLAGLRTQTGHQTGLPQKPSVSTKGIHLRGKFGQQLGWFRRWCQCAGARRSGGQIAPGLVGSQRSGSRGKFSYPAIMKVAFLEETSLKKRTRLWSSTYRCQRSLAHTYMWLVESTSQWRNPYKKQEVNGGNDRKKVGKYQISWSGWLSPFPRVHTGSRCWADDGDHPDLFLYYCVECFWGVPCTFVLSVFKERHLKKWFLIFGFISVLGALGPGQHCLCTGDKQTMDSIPTCIFCTIPASPLNPDNLPSKKNGLVSLACM